MRDLYLIDGDNVIFWLNDEFDLNDLETSRMKLMDRLQDFGAHRHVEIILVFDGQGKSKKVKMETVTPFFHIVFTPSLMTADSYIERESYKRREEFRHIYVVTSDGPEQNQVLGNGAYRIAVSELERQLHEDKKEQHIFLRRHNQANPRNEIGGALPEDVRRKLDALRKN